MAMLQSRTPAGYGSSIASSYRVQQPSTQHHGFFASPTESEFSEHFESPGTVRNWDEERVAEWLRSINCSQYVGLFMKNNITGANLMELDVAALKELGVTKVGDRIRISNQAKTFRSKEYKRISKRVTNRESLALLDNPTFTPPTSASPKAPHSARSQQSTRAEKRMSRQISDLSTLASATAQFSAGKSSSRPASPYVEQGAASARSRGFGSVGSPHRENTMPSSAKPADFSTVQSRYAVQNRSQTAPAETPQAARFPNHRPSPSTDSSITNSSILPIEKALIRVIYETGRTSVVAIEGCKNVEEIMLKALRKGQLNENHVKSYCFYVLDGTEPNPALCRRINETEVWRVCSDRNRLERNRLILRKIHMGEPDDDQLKVAASIASQIHVQQQQNNLIIPTSARSQLKIEKITGESLAPVSYPLSPASAKERERQIYTASELQRVAARNKSQLNMRPRTVLKEHFGGRPPSELIASDLSTYFPEYEPSEIDRTVRMSVRRSRRISRAASRLSTVSNFSVASSLKDAPPLPAISDQWLSQTQKGPRPLSVLRLGSGFRDSIASSSLEPLDEESPLEPDRKSYVSFAGSEVQVTDPEGRTSLHGYYDDARSSVAHSMISGVSGSSGDNGDSLNKRLSQAIHEDDEESDEELSEYLETDSWDNVKYMKGALIGQGSFGSVYLALHAVTGELMAVKQVEMPADIGSLDNKKKNMVEALKHEIGLLRELKHENIVSYLGSNSDESHLNIFLEYVPGGSVATMLVNYGPLGESLILNFVRQILTGLAYLHSKDIIHRDIKGANILVDNKGTVKISDFGISKRVEASSLLTTPSKKGAQRVSLQGSVFWMAPEVVRQTAYTKKADIWSLGCLIVEMLTGQHPHPNCTQMQAIFKIGNKTGNDASPTIPEGASAELKAFLGMTFKGEHEMRPSAEELLGSKWITRDLR